jgi:hypothetical protein
MSSKHHFTVKTNIIQHSPICKLGVPRVAKKSLASKTMIVPLPIVNEYGAEQTGFIWIKLQISGKLL